MEFSLHIRMSEENTLKTDFKRKQSGKKHMRQTERPEAFDQRHLNIHGSNWLWKSGAAPGQIFKNHKHKSSELSILEICHHSADLCPCALTLHILAPFEDISGHNPRLWEQTPFWGMRVQSGPYIGMEGTTK